MQRSKEAKEVRMRKELLESSRKPEKMNEVYYTRFESPVGGLFLAGDAKALRRVSFENGKRSVPPEAGSCAICRGHPTIAGLLPWRTKEIRCAAGDGGDGVSASRVE